MRLDRRYAMYVYWFVLVAAIVARVLQLGAVVDYQTGFYIQDGILPYALKIILISGIAVISFIIVAGSSKNVSVAGSKLESPFLADLDTLSTALSPVFSIAAMTLVFASVLNGVIEYRSLSVSGGIDAAFVIEFLLMLCSALVFLKIAVARTRESAITRSMGYSLLIPVIWYTFRSTMLFMSFIQITNISENLLTMLSSLSTLLFLIYLARFFAGIEKNNTRPMLAISGIVCSLMCAVSTLPRYILLIVGTVEMRQAMGTPNITELIFAVLAASVSALLLAKNKPVILQAQEGSSGEGKD
ncbi:MAG TPA: hypothetical protein VJX95_03165 [Oscillospiraceae bacterium]|nr:hypothetical protein [Oscillospiraceae bacterium]